MKGAEIKTDSNLLQLIFTLLIAAMLGTYSYMLYLDNKEETSKNISGHKTGFDEILIDPATYECEQPGKKSIFRVNGLSREKELDFVAFVVTSSGSIYEKSGMAEFNSTTKAFYRELLTDCRMEIVFMENRILISAIGCNAGDGSNPFDGTYIRK